MRKPTSNEIDERLRDLREIVETHEDCVVRRVAYEAEHAIRWATEATEGWPEAPDDVETAAELIRADLERVER